MSTYVSKISSNVQTLGPVPNMKSRKVSRMAEVNFQYKNSAGEKRLFYNFAIFTHLSALWNTR